MCNNNLLRQVIVALVSQFAEHRRREATVPDTLRTAQRVSVEARENADPDAQLIVRERHVRSAATRAGTIRPVSRPVITAAELRPSA